MKKIALYIADKSGVSLHRLILPHVYLNKELFQVTFGISNISELENYDMFVFNRLLPDGWIEKIREKYPNVKIICDIDDYWVLSTSHNLYTHYQNLGITDRIKKHIQLADAVITTTQILEKKIKLLNPNVYILPNSLIPDGEFKPNPTESPKLRFGIIGGSTHYNDVLLMDGITKQLPTDVMNQIQFVLCGFDKGVINYKNELGETEKRLMPWEQNVWVKMEKILTDNYRTISPEHAAFLKRYDYGIEMKTNEAYQRHWTRDIWNYATLYDEIDVLLVPLVDNQFNACKSELKMIEASVKGKPIIVSDVNPYKLCAISAIEKGGGLNPEGNCILVNNQKGSKGWAKAITKMVGDKQLRDTVTANIAKLTADGAKYNLYKVTDDRSEIYKKILGI